MRKRFKQFFRVTHLHDVAAYIQDKRRQLLRDIGKGVINFKLNHSIEFPIDIASRAPFQMFSTQDHDMQLEIRRFLELAIGKNCFLDIGSLHGIFSLSFCSINPNATAFSIEPSPKGFDVLVRNSLLNSEMNIRPIQTAFGAKEGRLEMHYEWIHLIANHNGNSTGHSIPMTSIDKFIDSHGIIPDILKIDVDGYEGDVISGGSNFLRKHRPILFLELHGDWINRYDHTPISIYETLEEHGFKFFDLNLKQIEDPKREFQIFANRIICTKDPDRLLA